MPRSSSARKCFSSVSLLIGPLVPFIGADHAAGEGVDLTTQASHERYAIDLRIAAVHSPAPHRSPEELLEEVVLNTRTIVRGLEALLPWGSASWSPDLPPAPWQRFELPNISHLDANLKALRQQRQRDKSGGRRYVEGAT